MKVAIIGPSAQQDAGMLYDKTWECWGLNSSYRGHYCRFSRMFNLHRFAHLERDVPQYVDWDMVWSRRNPSVPMYVIDSWRGLLKRQILFPRKDLAKQPRAGYHASSFDWLVSYAIHLKAKMIHIYGAHFALDSPREEPMSARACLEYWCGYAQGRGIEVREHHCHGLFRQFHLVMSNSVYGYDDVHMVEWRR